MGRRPFVSKITFARVAACATFFFAIVSPATAQTRTIFLLRNVTKQEIGDQVDILEDPSRSLTLADIRGERMAARFTPGQESALNFGFTRSAYWIRLVLRNASPLKEYLLQSSFPLVDRVDLYREEGGTIRHSSAGMTLPFSQREVKHRTIVFRIHPDGESVYYLRFENEDSMQIPLLIWSPAAFAAADHDEQIVLGAYYGILAVMTVYNFFLLIALRERGYFFYVVYITVFGFFLASQYGHAYEYLWPGWTSLARKLNPILAALLEATILIFTRHFLNTKSTAPRIDRAIVFFAAGAAVASPTAFFLNLTHGAILVVFFGLAASALALVAGVQSLRSGYRPARYYMTAFIILIVGAVLYSLKTFGILPVSFLTQYGMQLGSALEVTLLSLGLADRMNVMRRETELAQRALIREKTQSLDTQTRLTRAYARMVPGEFLQILGRESILDLNPGDQIQKEMTVLFTDIRSFTELSETMTPKESFDFLNSYLRRMNPVIQRNGGYIDKYIGDSIMALFPASPGQAVRAAVEMQTALRDFNSSRTARGFRAVEIGIGIHTGPVMFGTIGGAERMEVTVISDAVNLASRIEGLTKTYGVRILISESTFRRIEGSEWTIRMLGSFSVKGKKQEVTILEILDGLEGGDFDTRKETMSDFERGIFQYLNGDFSAALIFFERVLGRSPDDTAARHYANLIRGKVPGGSDAREG